MLYIVGTPIGNLEDMTFRAIRVLQNVEAIASEDTRRTGILLQHFQITTPQLSYHEHNRQQRLPQLLAQLQQGKNIALVTDAGMPGISDPGTELVAACWQAGITVVPIPGATAAITALCASGLPTDRFVFDGFLPAKGEGRQQRLDLLKLESRTAILYESPHRLRQTLDDLAGVLGGDRQIVLARELTKLHEEFWHGSLEEAIALYNHRQPQGEYTLVIEGKLEQKQVLSTEALKTELQQLMMGGLSRSQASRELAKLTDIPKRQLYQLALTLSTPNND